jgi:sulfite reductase (ferredoxin)
MTTGYYNLPADLAADIDTYEGEVRRFLAGEIPASVLKAKRVPRGVYEQRQDGTFMVRVRVAAGTVTAAQAGAVAALSREFGNGLLHVTTRQDLQFHDVAIENTPVVMRRLLPVGLTSKGGGGNTVRNVAACPYAGICPLERFDVTPCAHAVTEYLIALVGSYNLPRKYKIAFSGCSADCALAQVCDLGFIAAVRNGQPGFRVLAGGGMGAQSRIADGLLDWTPATEIIRVAETVRRLFDQFGDRTNRHKARLRFVFNRLGVDEFRRLFAERLAEVIRAGVPEWKGRLDLDARSDDPHPTPPTPVLQNGIRVIPQRQANEVAVPLYLPMGFLPASDLARIGELAARFSRELGLRTTRAQNLLIRSVNLADLPDLVAGLRSLETDVLSPTPLNRFISCAGASTCRLGICLARNAARACASALSQSGLARETLDAMDFYLNGCSNACGQQPVGPIGLFGAAQRSDDRLVPSYHITLGGRCTAEGARFGTPVGKVPARALPDFIRDLASDFESGRAPGESFVGYFDRLGPAHFEAQVARHAFLPRFEERPDYYRDWEASEDFSLAGRGAGECGAGVFEVIQQDLAVAKKAESPFDILLPTTRALLITRGVDAQDPDTVLREFDRHFIETGLVAEEFRAVLTRARGFTQGWKAALDDQADGIARLRDRVELLFSTLDASLTFHPPDAVPRDGNPPANPAVAATAELNLRGVACPLNFVKAKMKLESMQVGDSLALILDDGDPIRNVPVSFKNEGQAVGDSQQLNDGHWQVVVTKKR